ncbi:hypothetical protein Tco_0876729 [Tanacetum coccineum]|uniref:Uncharacterized protein n=1 Tax=Tanacetum coccineum TaxID=301880 RepID=A0ABQ5BUN6_9ASTR
MFVFFVNTPLQNTMAEQNVPNQPPTRTDEQIVPRSQWLTIGKSNLLFNAQKIQKNPIFQISMDLLRKDSGRDNPDTQLSKFWGESHNASLKNPKKKVTPLLIPYGRFTKVIIYYLASNYNIYQRPDSAVHHTGDDFILGNLKLGLER